MDVKATDRGFRLIEFTDRNGVPCTLQESSLATEAAIWFGRDGNRMHLTQDMVAELLPFLQRFELSGELGS